MRASDVWSLARGILCCRVGEFGSLANALECPLRFRRFVGVSACKYDATCSCWIAVTQASQAFEHDRIPTVARQSPNGIRSRVAALWHCDSEIPVTVSDRIGFALEVPRSDGTLLGRLESAQVRRRSE